MIDPKDLAREIASAHSNREIIAVPPSAREGGLDLTTAYAVERELVTMRQDAGHRAVGVKVGFANKAMWRVLKLDTLVWAHMYDDTVRHATANEATLPIGRMFAPKIEPEIVFKLRSAIPDGADAAAVLGAVEWLALGFEVIDCPYQDWKFTPVDFVASYGLHAGLIVGTPLAVEAGDIPALVDQLAAFTVTLQKNGEPVAQGSGKNSLKSPALCLGELSLAMKKAGEPLSAGAVISSGTLTEAQLLAPGDTCVAVIDGMPLPALTVRVL